MVFRNLILLILPKNKKTSTTAKKLRINSILNATTQIESRASITYTKTPREAKKEIWPRDILKSSPTFD